MRVDALLEHHARHAPPGALSAVLGDGFLLRRCRIHRNVRALTLRAGFRFRERSGFGYEALPLLTLDEIFARRRIPYLDNVGVLRAAERRVPGAFDIEQMHAIGLRANHTLHESSHCVARLLVRGQSDDDTLDPQRRLILDALFEESCANAVELLAASTARGAAWQAFSRLNNFQRAEDCRAVLRAFGTRDTLILLVVAFLHANFLYKEVAWSGISAALRSVLPEKALRRAGRAPVSRVFAAALSLSTKFRLATTPVHLRLHGIRGVITEVLDFDFMPELKAGRRLRIALEIFAGLIDGGVRPGPALAAFDAARRKRTRPSSARVRGSGRRQRRA